MLGKVTRRIASAVRHVAGGKLLLPLTGAQFEVMGTQSRTLARVIQLTAFRAQIPMKSDRFDSPPLVPVLHHNRARPQRSEPARQTTG